MRKKDDPGAEDGAGEDGRAGEAQKAVEPQPLRTYPMSCRACNCQFFTVEWVAFFDLTGRARIVCAECSSENVPVEPVLLNS